ncbi:MAG: hypothetical protein IPO00_08705 [Betaproteobacteria bacterium]|nr:hypothetical protein [Betaproteobacteria bacterium]
MAGLPWIKVWTVVPAHPKVQRLEKELGLKDALGMVIRLWCWTAGYCPSGLIPELDAPAAAKAAKGDATRKTSGQVIDALVTAGLLDPVPEGWRVHDWHDMQTVHLDAEEKRKAQARDRQAAYRARHGLSVTVTPAGQCDVTRDVTRDSVTEIEKETERQLETPPLADHRAAGEAARVAILHGRDETLSQKYPKSATLLGALEAVKCPAAWPKEPETRAAVEAAIGEQKVSVLVERVSVAIAESGKPWLGHHLAVLRGVHRKRTEIRSAIAAPAPHEAFGRGGERVIE